jgi:hypothetical protein
MRMGGRCMSSGRQDITVTMVAVSLFNK